MKKFVYLLVLLALVSINIFAAEETIKNYTTYQTRLTNQDIADVFTGNLLNYLSNHQYLLCQYEIYQDRSKQNYSWGFRIIKNTYNWGTVFNLRFAVSNGYFSVKVSNSDFTSGNISARRYTTFAPGTYGRVQACLPIMDEFVSFYEESVMTLKRYNDKYGTASNAAYASIGKCIRDWVN
jgi:hypothetical protein